MLLPELHWCAGCDSMHSLFVNRNGKTLCCFCDEKRVLP